MPTHRLNLSFRACDGGFRDLDLRFIGEVGLDRVVKILLARRLRLCKRSIFVCVELGLELVRLSSGELCFVLNELRLCLRSWPFAWSSAA